MTSRITLLVLGGHGRSGSTIAEMALAGAPGVVALGEVRYLWTRGLRDNYRCACGRGVRDCPFWAAVLTRTFGAWTEATAQEVLTLQRRVDDPATFLPRRGRHDPSALAEYTGILRRLYDASRRETGATLAVDGSKAPGHVRLALAAAGDGGAVLQVVRDARAVAFSLQRKKTRSEVPGAAADMPRYPPARTALRWLLVNRRVRALADAHPFRTMRYEDFVGSPASELSGLLAWLGRDPEPPAGLHRHPPVVAPAAHGVSGNPVRARRDPQVLRLDREWQDAMPRRLRALVTLIAWPELRRHGYV